MRTPIALIAFGLLAATCAHADNAVYRCQSPTGEVSLQSTPCPKGATQRKIPFQRPLDAAAPAATAEVTTPSPPPPQPAPTAAPIATIAGHPVTPANALRGPNQPYPLWECMRGDGSTYDSRDGVPGRQWVTAAPAPPDEAATAAALAQQQQHAALAKQMEKTGGAMVRPYQGPAVSVQGNDTPRDQPPPPPPGAGPGQWVADQCTQLPPEQACKRFAARRDLLRRQIYASKPSDRSLYAPEEQDLTTMLYATCRM